MVESREVADRLLPVLRNYRDPDEARYMMNICLDSLEAHYSYNRDEVIGILLREYPRLLDGLLEPLIIPTRD